MNRADRMLSVLSDGKPHSRREIFDRVGFMLTNNAASELRDRGFDVEHRNEGKVDVYQLRFRASAFGLLDAGDGTDGAGSAAPVSCIEQPSSPPASAAQLSGDTSAGRVQPHAAGNETTGSASPEPSAPVWLSHKPAASAHEGGPADGIHGAGADTNQLTIEDALAAA